MSHANFESLNFADLFDKLKGKEREKITEVSDQKVEINPQVKSADFVISETSQNNNNPEPLEAKKEALKEKRKYKKRDIFQ